MISAIHICDLSLKSKEERILELETENAILHLRLAEVQQDSCHSSFLFLFDLLNGLSRCLCEWSTYLNGLCQVCVLYCTCEYVAALNLVSTGFYTCLSALTVLCDIISLERVQSQCSTNI